MTKKGKKEPKEYTKKRVPNSGSFEKGEDPKRHAWTKKETIDNNFAEKYKTDEGRKEVFGRWLEHLRGGLTVDSFPECSHKTILRYVQKYPDIFLSEKIEDAKRQGRLIWEKLGLAGTRGSSVETTEIVKGKKITKRMAFNPTAWIFNMKNKYGWKDKVQLDSTVTLREELTEKQREVLRRIQEMEDEEE